MPLSSGAELGWIGATVGLSVMMSPFAATHKAPSPWTPASRGSRSLLGTFPGGPSNAWSPSGPPRPARLDPELPPPRRLSSAFGSPQSAPPACSSVPGSPRPETALLGSELMGEGVTRSKAAEARGR